MTTDYQEYRQKLEIKSGLDAFYSSKTDGKSLKSMTRIARYLRGMHPYIDRGIAYAHLDIEPITSLLAQKTSFTIVSGFQPSSSLHLGHLALFNFLRFLQNLGADIFIPITNDETYVDGKALSLAHTIATTREKVIPQLVSLGFDSTKTKLFTDSDYPDVYNFAMHLSPLVKNTYVKALFGNKEVLFDNPGQVFYRGAVQLAQILMVQLPEFGGKRHTLVPVGPDQHPYILLARDVAKKCGLTPPSELVINFEPSLVDPTKKMSGSTPGSAIFLDDTPEVIKTKIRKAFTGSLTTLAGHKKYGALPEICPVFQILRFHHPDTAFVEKIEADYREGKLTTSELKTVVIDFLTAYLAEVQKAKNMMKDQNFKAFMLAKPLTSFLLN